MAIKQTSLDIADRTGGTLGSQCGSVLIYLVAVLLLAGVLSAGIVSLTTTSSFTELSYNPSDRARFLARSGLDYAVESAAGAGIYTVDDGNEFEIERIGRNVRVRSTVHKDSLLEASYKISGGPAGPVPFPGIGFDETGDGDLDDYWEPIGETDAGYHEKGQTDDGAVRVKGEEGLLGFDWHENDAISLDLKDIRDGSGGLLSYYLQLKIKVEVKQNKGQFYMMGLNFRLVTDENEMDSGYGLSFFKYTPDDDPPEWAQSLTGFEDIKDGLPRIVLWKKESAGNIERIDHASLSDHDGNLLNDDGELKDWVTMAVGIEERRKDNGYEVENHITSYIQQPEVMPKGERDWDFSNYVPVNWSEHADNVIIDDSLDSSGVETGQNEIGVHSLYDSQGQNEQFLADFGFAL